MKKWFKKHIETEWMLPSLSYFILTSIWFEKSYGGYSMEFVLFGFGFYIRYNTKKSLKYFKDLEKEVKKENWYKKLNKCGTQKQVK